MLYTQLQITQLLGVSYSTMRRHILRTHELKPMIQKKRKYYYTEDEKILIIQTFVNFNKSI